MKDITIHVLRQLDVGDAIDVERASALLEGHDASRGATMLRGPAPSPSSGVVLARKPLDLRLRAVTIGPFDAQVRVRLFDFGVIAIRFTMTTSERAAEKLVDMAAKLAEHAPLFDAQARAVWADLGGQLGASVQVSDETPPEILMEDFTVWVLPETPVAHEPSRTPEELFAQIVLGEPAGRRLANAMVQEITRRAIRYFEDDLVLVDYDNALVVDRAGAIELVDIFEIASAQLLELRYYDAVLARAQAALTADFKRVRTPSALLRSPFLSLSRRAAALTLELGEMTDRLERAITLVGDTYTVQVYREAALRFRLAEAGAVVREKIGMVVRVAEMLSRQVQARRDLVLEILVVVLIAVEVVIALR